MSDEYYPTMPGRKGKRLRITGRRRGMPAPIDMDNLDQVVTCTEDAQSRTEAGWEQRWRKALERRGVDPERARVKTWVHLGTRVNGLSHEERQRLEQAEADMRARFPDDNLRFAGLLEPDPEEQSRRNYTP